MFRAAVFLAIAALVAGPARAQQVTEIFKCKGTDGHWTYTNDRREAEKQKCEVVTRQVNVAPAPPAPPAVQRPNARNQRPADFPKETRRGAKTRCGNTCGRTTCLTTASTTRATAPSAAPRARARWC